MKSASFPLELADPLLRKGYTRDAYAPLLCRGINLACAGRTPRPRKNLIFKSHSRALSRRFNSRSPAQPTVILVSNDVVPRPEDLGYTLFSLRAIGTRTRKYPNTSGSCKQLPSSAFRSRNPGIRPILSDESTYYLKFLPIFSYIVE